MGLIAFRIVSKKATNYPIDDNLNDIGLKTITKSGYIALFTGAHANPKQDVKLTIDLPGEYEVSDSSICDRAAIPCIDVSETS